MNNNSWLIWYVIGQQAGQQAATPATPEEIKIVLGFLIFLAIYAIAFCVWIWRDSK